MWLVLWFTLAGCNHCAGVEQTFKDPQQCQTLAKAKTTASVLQNGNLRYVCVKGG